MFPVDEGPGTFAIVAPSSYEPAMTYLISIDLDQTGPVESPPMRWGFQLTVLDALFQPAGTVASTDENTQVQLFPLSDREYVAHSEPGTAAGQPNGNSWSFQWTAPDADVGPVTFYAAGNAANNNDSNTGEDYIYTTTATVPVPEPGSLAAGLLALSTAAALAQRLSGRPA
jgi:hypothetical protein